MERKENRICGFLRSRLGQLGSGEGGGYLELSGHTLISCRRKKAKEGRAGGANSWGGFECKSSFQLRTQVASLVIL